MTYWRDGFNVMKNGGVIPVGDYFVVLTPKNGYLLTELYVSLDEAYKKFTPAVVERKVEVKKKKEEPVRLSSGSQGEVGLFG